MLLLQNKKYISFTNFTTSNHNKCLKLHHSYFYICFTVLAVQPPKITSLLPEPDNASPLVYENTPSFITLPITVKLQDIENQTNLLLNGLIYQDNNIDDDDIEIGRDWLPSPSYTPMKIRIELPLKKL
jgi:hypothetical protein